VLARLGEHSVTDVQDNHPTLGIILPNIELSLVEVLSRKLWCNTVPDRTLYPGIDSKIAVPTDLLAFVPDVPFASLRGGYLMNMGTGLMTWDIPVTGTAVYRVDFEDLPETVASVVFYSALVHSYLTDIGRESIVQEWRGMLQTATILMEREHLQNRKYTTVHSPRFQRIASALRG